MISQADFGNCRPCGPMRRLSGRMAWLTKAYPFELASKTKSNGLSSPINQLDYPFTKLNVTTLEPSTISPFDPVIKNYPLTILTILNIQKYKEYQLLIRWREVKLPENKRGHSRPIALAGRMRSLCRRLGPCLRARATTSKSSSCKTQPFC